MGNYQNQKRIEADTRTVEDKLFGMVLAASPDSRKAVPKRLNEFNKDMKNPVQFTTYPLRDEIEGLT